MKLKKYISLGLASLCCVWATSCLGDLDQEPILDKSSSSIHNEADCQSFLAKIYSGFGLSGNSSDTNVEPDLQGGDQGSLVFSADCSPCNCSLPMKRSGTGRTKVLWSYAS